MKGIIFNPVEDAVPAAHGQDVWGRIHREVRKLHEPPNCTLTVSFSEAGAR